MALQTKTYFQSSNTYTLELTLVEHSTSTSENTSSVGYTLKLKSTTKNFAQYGVGAKVELNGKLVAERDRGTAPKITLGTYSEVTLLSGTATVGHNSDGSKSMAFAYSLDMAAASYTPGAMSGSGTMALTQIPRGATITSAPNFTDEDNPVVKFSNPAGMAMELCIKTKDESKILVAYRKASGSSYTFSLTQGEREALQAYATKNTATVVFVLRSTLSGGTFFSTSAKTLTIKNPAPILAPTVEDTNPATLALTGDAGVMVRYQSTVSVTIGASAVKGATLVSQSVTCGGKTLTQDGTLEGVEAGTFYFTAKDSRGNSTTKTISKTLVEYLPPTCNIGQGRPTPQGTFDFAVSGAAFTGSFGVVDNSITVEARYRPQGAAWGGWKPMEVRPGSSNYTAVLAISGLDYRQTYDFQARCTDRLVIVESQVVALSSVPGFWWGKNDFYFDIPVYFHGVKYTPDVLKNLLINPFFRINQRGSSSYTITNPAYTIDCWKSSGTTTNGQVQAGQRYAKLTNSGGTLGLGQYVEDYGGLAGKTVTLSVMVEILSGSYHLSLDDGTETTGETISARGTQVCTLTKTISNSPSKLWCQWISEGAASCQIFAAKLEVGDHQTLAIQGEDGTWQVVEQPDPNEILKCYRYQFLPESNSGFPIGYGFAFGTGAVRAIFPCPVRMRTNPSVVYMTGDISGLSIFNNGTVKIPTAISATSNQPGGIGATISASGLASNRSCIVRTTSAKILFDANL